MEKEEIKMKSIIICCCSECNAYKERYTADKTTEKVCNRLSLVVKDEYKFLDKCPLPDFKY
jgi:hypothetical protein